MKVSSDLECSHEALKRPTLSMFIEVLETLSEQGFIDVGPTEGEYDLTEIYDFLVLSGLAWRDGVKEYWLQLANEEGCLRLTNLLINLFAHDNGVIE